MPTQGEPIGQVATAPLEARLIQKRGWTIRLANVNGWANSSAARSTKLDRKCDEWQNSLLHIRPQPFLNDEADGTCGIRNPQGDLRNVSRVGQAVPDDRREFARLVPGEPVRHLDRRTAVLVPSLEYLRQVLSGVLRPGEKKRDLPISHSRHDARCEDSNTLIRIDGSLREGLLPPLSHQLEDLRRGVVVVEYLSLGGLTLQLFMGWPDLLPSGLDHIPLGRCGEWYSQALLEVIQPVEGRPGPVFQERHHARRGGVVFLFSYRRGWSGGEDLAAEVTPQLLERPDEHHERRHCPYADEDSRLLQAVHLAVAALFRTGVTGLEGLVRDLGPFGVGVVLRAVSPVPRLLFLLLLVGGLLWRRAGLRPRRLSRGCRIRLGSSRGPGRDLFRLLFLQNVLRLLALRAEGPSQPRDRRILVLDEPRQIGERSHQLLEKLVVILVNRGFFQALEERIEFVHVEIDRLRILSGHSTW